LSAPNLPFHVALNVFNGEIGFRYAIGATSVPQFACSLTHQTRLPTRMHDNRISGCVC